MEPTGQNQEIIFYEYFINHKTCRVEQRRCIGVQVQKNLYRMKFENKDIKRKLVNIDEFEVTHLFRIFSFTDDFEYYKQVLIDKYAITVEKNRVKLEKQEQFLEKVRNE